MEGTGLHSGLKMRLTALATRIAELRHKMSQVRAGHKEEPDQNQATRNHELTIVSNHVNRRKPSCIFLMKVCLSYY
jgi:hypothetical protein